MIDYADLFGKMKPGFFNEAHIRSIPDGEAYDEMVMKLGSYDTGRYKKEFPQNVEFGIYEGDRNILFDAVRKVIPEWIPLFGEDDDVYCATVDGEIASFCIVEDMGRHEVCEKIAGQAAQLSPETGANAPSATVARIGGPGCVGTVPKYRNLGLGLTMVSHVTAILQERGYDYSYIHYTGVAPWYAKLGYEKIITWDHAGIIAVYPYVKSQ